MLLLLTLALPTFAGDCADDDAMCHYEAAATHLSAARAVNVAEDHAFESDFITSPQPIEAVLTSMDWLTECPNLARDASGFSLTTHVSGPGFTGTTFTWIEPNLGWQGAVLTGSSPIEPTKACLVRGINSIKLHTTTGIGARRAVS